MQRGAATMAHAIVLKHCTHSSCLFMFAHVPTLTNISFKHCWLVDWLVGWLAGWLAGWSVRWLASWLMFKLLGCLELLKHQERKQHPPNATIRKWSNGLPHSLGLEQNPVRRRSMPLTILPKEKDPIGTYPESHVRNHRFSRPFLIQAAPVLFYCAWGVGLRREGLLIR